MTRGKLAKKYNINPETIRYYETIGLLEPIIDQKSGYRTYDDHLIMKLDLILRFKELGFSLQEIKLFFNLLKNSSKQPNMFRDYIEDKIEEIDRKIAFFNITKDSLIKFRDKEDKGTCDVFSKFVEKT